MDTESSPIVPLEAPEAPLVFNPMPVAQRTRPDEPNQKKGSGLLTGIRLGSGLFLIALFSATFHVWHLKTISLQVDGKQRRILSRGKSVSDLLTEQRIVLGPKDFVSLPLKMPVGRFPITVTRVIERPVNIYTSTPATVQSELKTGTNLRPILAERGEATDTTDTYLVTFYDGHEKKRRRVQRKVFHHPFYHLKLFDSNGALIENFDLLKQKSLRTIATGYYVGDPLVPSDETFLGYKLRRGLIAVDPKVIPLRTRLYVPGYGYGYAADTGSRIKGNRIDLAVKDRHEERKYMHRPMIVYILGDSRHW